MDLDKRIIDSHTIKCPIVQIAMMGRGSLLCTVSRFEVFMQIRSSFVPEACTPHQSSSSRVAAPASNGTSSFMDYRRYAERGFLLLSLMLCTQTPPRNYSFPWNVCLLLLLSIMYFMHLPL